MEDSSRRHGKKKARRKGRRKLNQRLTDYILFGFPTTVCLGIFVGCYALVLLVVWPLLLAETPHQYPDERPQDYLKHMHLPPALKEVAQHDSEVVSEVAGAVKKRFHKLREGRGVTDAALLKQAKEEFEVLQRKKKEAQANAAISTISLRDDPMQKTNHRQGFMVLGMHRSGTSMLSGLLHTSCGYNVGGPLIGSSFDNEKGFFERVDIVLQNDEFMKAQKVWWAANVINYDWEQAIMDKDDGTITFKQGKPGLDFLNDPSNAPWMQKDPRMCITLKTWLKLMNSEPAVVFTYRHPLEVAMSLKKREQNFSLERGLRLWIVYNMRAIQNSKGLCVIHSSNDAILADPLNEIQRISDVLTSKCNVPEPPYRLRQEDVDKFIDPSLQHNRNQRKAEETDKEVIATYNDGKCLVHAYDSEEEEGSLPRRRETQLYAWAMKIFCDFQSGEAYGDNYEWPQLQ